MKVYMFQAALLCEECGEMARKSNPFPAGADIDNEHTWDSDQWPKGPYDDGGGEADCPQHCDACTRFLENLLTPDGERYIAEAFLDPENHGKDVTEEWKEFYGVPKTVNAHELMQEFRMTIDNDLWGSTMGWWFAVAGEMYERGLDIPVDWQYRASPLGGRDIDAYETPICEAATDRALVLFGRALHRYAAKLKAAGEDY